MIFLNETTLNGRTQIYSSVELNGFKLYGSNYVLEYKGELHKKLFGYWLTKSELNSLCLVVKTYKTSF